MVIVRWGIGEDLQAVFSLFIYIFYFIFTFFLEINLKARNKVVQRWYMNKVSTYNYPLLFALYI